VFRLSGLYWQGRRNAAKLRLRQNEIVWHRVPKAFDGFRILHLSDLHVDMSQQSYMDAVALAAALPGEPAFVAKKELAGQVFAGPFLRRLGTLFVERFDVTASLADAETVTAAARKSRILVFFLKVPLRAGPAFPPSIWEHSRWQPKPSCQSCRVSSGGQGRCYAASNGFRAVRQSVSISPPSSGADFASALKLRDSVREAILARCGEPDLGELVKPTPPQPAT
jgi:Acyltransferase